MNIRFFYIFFLFCTAHFYASSQTLPINRAEQFIQDCKTYTIEPGWVIQSFLQMSATEYTDAWHHFVTLLTHNMLYTKKDRTTVLQELACYAKCIEHLYIARDNNMICMHQNTDRPHQKKYKKITDYWKTINKNKDYHDFYAFYFDQVAAQFIEDVMNAHQNESLAKSYKKIAASYSLLLSIFESLQESQYTEQYMQHLKRYDGIIALLQKDLGVQCALH